MKDFLVKFGKELGKEKVSKKLIINQKHNSYLPGPGSEKNPLGELVSTVGDCIRSFQCADNFHFFRSDSDFVVSILIEFIEFWLNLILWMFCKRSIRTGEM